MKFEKWSKQFYVTPADIVSNSEITQENMADELGDEFDRDLRYKITPRIYRYILQKSRASHRQHALGIKKLIYDSKEKQRYLLEAVIEHMRGIIHYGRDMEDYDPNGKGAIHEGVETILREGGLFITGEILIPIQELEGDWE